MCAGCAGGSLENYPKYSKLLDRTWTLKPSSGKKNLLIDPFWMFASLGEFQPMAGSCSLMDYMWEDLFHKRLLCTQLSHPKL
jgi:hypothetical protein